MESSAIASETITDAPAHHDDDIEAYAGLGARLLAFLIDQVFLVSMLASLVAIGALEIFLTSDYGAVDPPDRSYYIAIGIIAAFLPLWLLYHIILWGTSGKTIGKMIMGIQVVRRDGEQIGIGRAVVRTLAYLVSTLTLHISTLFALFGHERRTMHDVIAGTIVATDAGVRLHRSSKL
jgi:uncharacterized RDD family membrane protein YckC